MAPVQGNMVAWATAHPLLPKVEILAPARDLSFARDWDSSPASGSRHVLRTALQEAAIARCRLDKKTCAAKRPAENHLHRSAEMGKLPLQWPYRFIWQNRFRMVISGAGTNPSQDKAAAGQPKGPARQLPRCPVKVDILTSPPYSKQDIAGYLVSG